LIDDIDVRVKNFNKFSQRQRKMNLQL